jgi:hypothetical protein
MTTRYTPEYKALQEKFHVDRPDYGIHAHRWADQIMGIAQQLGSSDILDYGAGKGTLQKSIPFPIQQYDPFIPEFAAEPRPASLVCALDTLEHIEPECLDAVLAHIASLTRQLLFADIAQRPASKFLPDGRNAHLLLRPPNWWLSKLMQYFSIQQFTATEKSLLILAAPLPAKPAATATHEPAQAPELKVHMPTLQEQPA